MPFRDEHLDMLHARREELKCELQQVEARIRSQARTESRRKWGDASVLLLLTCGTLAVFCVVFLIAVRPTCACTSRIEDARTSAQSIRGAVELYLAGNPAAACPCVHDLVEERVLNADTRTRDPWDSDFSIECEGEEVIVISGGPDGRFGTEDDVL